MSFLLAAVVVVGVLGVLNLLFALGVVRRLREHTKLLDALYELAGDGALGVTPGKFPAVGERVGDFAATTVDGLPVSRDGLADATVVAFVSPDCRGCRAEQPALRALADSQPRERTLVVVDGRSAAPDTLVDMFAPVALVVVEDAGLPLAAAFQVGSVPAFCLVGPGGEIRAVASRVNRLPLAART